MTTSTALTIVPTSNALAFPTPTDLGSIDRYIQAVNQFPLLTQEEETNLAQRWQLHQDLEAARQLVLSHLRLVIAISRQYSGYGLPQADLIQEGNIGLMKAVKRFDSTRGVRLVSFAVHWIKAEMHEYILRNWRLVKVATTKAQRKLFFNLRSMKSSDHLSPEQYLAIANDLGVKPEEVREMDLRLSGGDIAFDSPFNDEESYAPIDYLEAPNANPLLLVEEAQSAAYEHRDLGEALAQLDERSRDIIQARWLNEGSTTLQELAARYAVSAERIRQLEQQALKKLRTWMGADAIFA
ncbi:MAG: RNA polymerase sigma factor RpoH [Pseudomonadota bacterium]